MHQADYSYLGSGWTVQVNSPQMGTALTYIKQGREPIGDGCDQYTLQRGTLNSSRTGITGTPGREEDFRFDPTGNWSNYLTRASGITTLNQGRTHNKVNEITAINGSSAYIAEDNIVTAQRPDNWLAVSYLAYDAWNGLVSVSGIPSVSSSSGSGHSEGSRSGGYAVTTVAATYQYDGLNEGSQEPPTQPVTLIFPTALCRLSNRNVMPSRGQC